MTPDKIADALKKTYETLECVKAKEEEVAKAPAIEKKPVGGKASMKRRKAAKEKGYLKRVLYAQMFMSATAYDRDHKSVHCQPKCYYYDCN